MTFQLELFLPFSGTNCKVKLSAIDSKLTVFVIAYIIQPSAKWWGFQKQECMKCFRKAPTTNLQQRDAGNSERREESQHQLELWQQGASQPVPADVPGQQGEASSEAVCLLWQARDQNKSKISSSWTLNLTFLPVCCEEHFELHFCFWNDLVTIRHGRWLMHRVLTDYVINSH